MIWFRIFSATNIEGDILIVLQCFLYNWVNLR